MQHALKLATLIGTIIVAMSACKKTDSPIYELEVANTQWKLVSRITDNVQVSVPDSISITLDFGSNNTLSTHGSCNGYGGKYAIVGTDELTISSLIGTEIYCNSSQDWEDPYIEQFQAAKQIDIDGTLLILSNSDDRLIFEAQ